MSGNFATEWGKAITSAPRCCSCPMGARVTHEKGCTDRKACGCPRIERSHKKHCGAHRDLMGECDCAGKAHREDCPALMPSERLVALVLAQIGDFETGRNFYQGPESLARKTGYDIATVKAARARLELLGWLQREETGGYVRKTEDGRAPSGRNGGRSNSYNLTYPGADFLEDWP